MRCSLEDVAENHINSCLSRGEKQSAISRSLCDTLRKTNASTEIVMSTMFGALRGNFGAGSDSGELDDLDVIKAVGRANVEAAINLDSEC